MELRIHPASHDAELRVFSQRTYTIVSLLLTYARLWGGLFLRHNDSNKQQQSQPHNFAVAVVVVALGSSVYFISFPAA